MMKMCGIFVAILTGLLMSACHAGADNKTYEFGGFWLASELSESRNAGEFCLSKRSLSPGNDEVLYIDSELGVHELSLADIQIRQNDYISVNSEKVSKPAWRVTDKGEVFDSNEGLSEKVLSCTDCVRILDHTMRITSDNVLLSTWRVIKSDGAIYSRQRKYVRMASEPHAADSAKQLAAASSCAL